MGIEQFKEDLKSKSRCGGIGDGKSVVDLKNLISKWADGIDHHGLKNFGDRVDIISSIGRSSYIVSLDFEYERRYIKAEVFSYTGQNIFSNTVKIPDDQQLWKLRLPSVNRFSNQIQKYGVREEIYICDTCIGRGEVVCHGCSGKRQVTCDGCQGKRSVKCTQWGCVNGRVSCNMCQGSGLNYDKERKCSHCNGDGYKTCPTCVNGWKPCERCDGHGILTCGVCSGTGSLQCSRCSGAGKLAKCTYLQDEFIHRHSENWAHSSEAGGDLQKRIIGKSSEAVDVSTVEDLDIPLNLFDLIDDKNLSASCKSFLSTLRDFVDSNRSDCRIIRQKMVIRKVEVIEILYRYSNKEYRIWSLGETGMWASLSPMSELRDSMLDNAQGFIKQKDFSSAMDSINKVIAMAQGEDHPTAEYQKLRNNIAGTIKSQYLMGGILGGTVVPFLGNILGAIIGLIYWNVFAERIRENKKRFLCSFFASLLMGIFFVALILIKF